MTPSLTVRMAERSCFWAEASAISCQEGTKEMAGGGRKGDGGATFWTFPHLCCSLAHQGSHLQNPQAFLRPHSRSSLLPLGPPAPPRLSVRPSTLKEKIRSPPGLHSLPQGSTYSAGQV